MRWFYRTPPGRVAGTTLARMRPRRLIAAAFVAAALGAPAAAHGAALAPLKPCYVSVSERERERIPVAGSGFTPETVVEILIDNRSVGGAVTDADGTFGPLAIKAPYQPRGTSEFTLTAAERGNETNTISVGSRVTDLKLRLKPAPYLPRQRVTWIARGFTAVGRVYAHYVREGKHRETVRLGRPSGACGRLRVRRPYFPFRPDVGRWAIRVDQQSAWTRIPRGIHYFRRLTVSRAG